jgi:hypothetical protein
MIDQTVLSILLLRLVVQLEDLSHICSGLLRLAGPVVELAAERSVELDLVESAWRMLALGLQLHPPGCFGRTHFG